MLDGFANMAACEHLRHPALGAVLLGKPKLHALQAAESFYVSLTDLVCQVRKITGHTGWLWVGLLLLEADGSGLLMLGGAGTGFPSFATLVLHRRRFSGGVMQGGAG